MSQTTEQGSSLEAAGKAIGSLLSVQAEDKQPAKPQPEQTTATAPESEQAPAAPTDESDDSTEGSEPAESEAAEEIPEPSSQPRTFTVKVNGQDIEVTEDEVLKGYSRTEDYTRKTQQLAEQRKTFEEQEVAGVRAERQQYGSMLEQFKTHLEAMSPKEPNWEERRNALPADEFAVELLNWQVNQKRIATITAEQDRVKAAEAADAHAGFAKYVQEQQEKLADVIPDFKEPEKATALKKELGAFAKSRGFTDEELGSVTDHRVVLLLHDAMRAEKTKAKAPQIQNKIEKAMVTSAPGSRTTAAPRDALKAAKARVRSSGSLEDGGAAIAHLLEKTG